jgi:hypothetical protein
MRMQQLQVSDFFFWPAHSAPTTTDPPTDSHAFSPTTEQARSMQHLTCRVHPQGRLAVSVVEGKRKLVP